MNFDRRYGSLLLMYRQGYQPLEKCLGMFETASFKKDAVQMMSAYNVDHIRGKNYEWEHQTTRQMFWSNSRRTRSPNTSWSFRSDGNQTNDSIPNGRTDPPISTTTRPRRHLESVWRRLVVSTTGAFIPPTQRRHDWLRSTTVQSRLSGSHHHSRTSVMIWLDHPSPSQMTHIKPQYFLCPVSCELFAITSETNDNRVNHRLEQNCVTLSRIWM